MRHVANFRSSRSLGAGWGSVSAAARLATTKARMVASFMVLIVSGSGEGFKDLGGLQRCGRMRRGPSYSTHDFMLWTSMSVLVWIIR
jgi:hypothetical protein